MEYREMTTTLKKLERNYKYKIAKEQLMDWYEEFKELDYIYFARAIKLIIKSNKFFPNVKEIYEAIEKTKNYVFTSAEKRYKMLKQGINPKWLNENLEIDLLSEEEKKEMKRILEVYK